jgi:hypothetical protein
MLTFDTLSLGYQQFQFLTYTLGASQDLLTILKLPMTVLTWFTSIPNSYLSHHCMIYSRGIRQFHNVAYSLFHCCTPWNCHTAVISKMIGSTPHTSDCFTDCIILLTSPPWFTHLKPITALRVRLRLLKPLNHDVVIGVCCSVHTSPLGQYSHWINDTWHYVNGNLSRTRTQMSTVQWYHTTFWHLYNLCVLCYRSRLAGHANTLLRLIPRGNTRLFSCTNVF